MSGSSSTIDPDSSVDTDKPSWGRRTRRHGLQLLGASGLAVAQPLLDVYGSNPEAFVANGLSSFQIVTFALVIVLAPPLVALAIETAAYAINKRAGDLAHSLALGAFAVLFVAGLLRQVGADTLVVVTVVAILFAVGLAVAERRFAAVRNGLVYLALAPMLFLGMFLFASSTSRLVTSTASAVAGEVSWNEPDRPPVVFLVLDEFPLATIINSDGEVNAERFPNFARLADQSDWFRNATSNAYLTERAVPSLLTGTSSAPDLLPIANDYPNNLFTLLGSEYDVWNYEVFTDLCPSDVCNDEGPSAPQGGVGQALRDSTVVYEHLVLPESLRDDLPPIDQSWNEFIIDDRTGHVPGQKSAPEGPDSAESSRSGDSTTSGVEEPDGDDKWTDLGPEGRAAPAQAAVIEQIIADMDTEAESHFWFAHIALPHAPWMITPMGNEMANTASLYRGDDRTDEQMAWNIRLIRQAHLLQVGATDQMLGRMIDRMEELGIWESAMVVVTSDHGNSFLPPDPGRTPTEENVHAVFRVPMFVKQPGQTEGTVRDENAITLDLVPSIADLMALDTGWSFDGHSLYDDSAYPDEKRVMAGPGTPEYVPVSFADFLETIVAEHERDFPRDDWIGVAAIGRHAGLVGEEAAGLDVTADDAITVTLNQAEELASLDLGAAVIPGVIEGTLHLPDGPSPPDELLFALNGRIAGVAGGLVETDGGWAFEGVVAEQFLVDGANTLQVLVPLSDGSFIRAG